MKTCFRFSVFTFHNTNLIERKYSIKFQFNTSFEIISIINALKKKNPDYYTLIEKKNRNDIKI